jgi:hypothetical protein
MVEGMKKFFTKFLPKDRTYGLTIENRVIIYLAICIDSVGYQETYLRLATKAGTEVGNVQAEMNTTLKKNTGGITERGRTSRRKEK